MHIHFISCGQKFLLKGICLSGVFLVPVDYSLFTGFIVEIHVNFTVLELSGIFPHARTTELLNKLFYVHLCLKFSECSSFFSFKVDDYKTESTYIALHTCTITYSYLLDQNISETTIVEKVRHMFSVQHTLFITLRVFHMFDLIISAVGELTVWHEIMRC
jgi:hypothetical protein